jgi:hypothetical protein
MGPAWQQQENFGKNKQCSAQISINFSNICFIKNLSNTPGDLTLGKPKSVVFAKTQNVDTLSEEKFETLLNTLENESNPLYR